MPKSDKVGVVIGRFQVDDLHEGHLSLLDHVQERHDKFLVLLGCRISALTKKNPLDYRLRQEMISHLYPQATILPVLDCSTNEKWSSNVDTLISTTFPGQSATIYGGEGNNIEGAYSGKHEVKIVDVTISTYHAEERRQEIAANPLHSPDFRAGVIYALHAQYPRTEITVDAAGLWRNAIGDLCVALGKKAGEDGFRLPGGFVSPSDTTLAAAAAREFTEETGLYLSTVRPIQDFLSEDWRSVDQPDVTHRTFLFYGWVTTMAPSLKGGDDLDYACWEPLSKISESNIVPEHRDLMEALFYKLDAEAIPITQSHE